MRAPCSIAPRIVPLISPGAPRSMYAHTLRTRGAGRAGVSSGSKICSPESVLCGSPRSGRGVTILQPRALGSMSKQVFSTHNQLTGSLCGVSHCPSLNPQMSFRPTNRWSVASSVSTAVLGCGGWMGPVEGISPVSRPSSSIGGVFGSGEYGDGTAGVALRHVLHLCSSSLCLRNEQTLLWTRVWQSPG